MAIITGTNNKAVNNPKSLKICSYNMHGFKNGVSTVQDLCLNYDVILLQEHFLLKTNLNKFVDININFQAFSLSSIRQRPVF